MNTELKIIYSKNVFKPTLFLVLPFEHTKDGIKEEIEEILQRTDKQIDLRKEQRDNNQDLGEYIRDTIGSKELYGFDDSTKDYDSDDDRLFEKNGTTDWLFVLPSIVREYPGFKDVDNPVFHTALDETLFAALLGAAVYMNGKIKSIGSSMIGIYYNKRGWCWITYPAADMKIYLKKGMYNEVANDIIYSEKMEGLDRSVIKNEQLRSTTFGNYPYCLVDMTYDTLNDPDGLLNVIKYAKNQ